ncbi:TetR/AcrR family transcriptional regulator [Desulfatibacillum aliphaticivorans]|uniref:TetR/AcrR family transcriptional regulator n=1 Tax=Desulfatibacillum aliphaticivorans TaxID=218208 RepID=UPI0004882107|nr:TetR/AcrR family transcriptional regulator [Desulfatibacillum aliphaticivorans]
MKSNKNNQLALTERVKPTQARAVETREKILAAAAQLLEDSGVDGLTTKKAAELAGVRIRSVYRYFPNKLAIVHALAQQATLPEEALFDVYRDLENPNIDWKPALRELIDAVYMIGAEIPGLKAIRAAMQASPELRAVDAAMNERHAQALCQALLKRRANISSQKAMAAARTVVETSTCMLDLAWFESQRPEGAENAALLLEELKTMASAYLAVYLPS